MDEKASIMSELIIPCNCKTTLIHRKCLDQWRLKSNNPDSLAQCPTCKKHYEFETIEDSCAHFLAKLHLIFNVLRDILIIMIITTSVILLSYYLATLSSVYFTDHGDTYVIVIDISLTIIYTGTLFVLLFITYLVVALLCMKIFHCNRKLYKPYLLYLMQYDSKNETGVICDGCDCDIHCFICIRGDFCGECNEDAAGIIAVICAAFCCCIITVEFVHIVSKVLTLHFRNHYKNSHCRVYRIKNLGQGSVNTII
jgi:hypothetical protein